MDILDPVLLARLQFAFTIAFHILFPTLTMGLGVFLLIVEARWLYSRDPLYYRLYRFWAKVFALAFGMGVVTGVVLSFEIGTNFSRFSEVTGNVVGPLFAYEVLTAFFLEAGFLGIMLFGWQRVGDKLHFFATVMVALGTTASAFWILAANSWMHTPAGYSLDSGIFHVSNWRETIFNPSFPYRLAHMLNASYLAATFLVAGVSARYLLRGSHTDSARRSFSIALALAAVLAPAQLLLGDLHGLNTQKYQPIKVAAMEGLWETTRGSPLLLFAVPDMAREINYYEIRIPKAASLILKHDANGEVRGLKEAAPADRPYVPFVFYAFRLMIGIGLLLIALALIGLWLRFSGRLYRRRWYLWSCFLATPLGFVATLSGWVVTETGRQPWVVQGLLRTAESVSAVPAGSVLTSFVLFVLVYNVLLVAFLYFTWRLIKAGPEEGPQPAPSPSLTAWLQSG